MGIEIERKFLVVGDSWRGKGSGTSFRQGYLSTDRERVVRVRLAGERGFLTVKGKGEGAARAEFEFEIPAADAAEMLDALCLRPLIEKVRYRIPFEGLVWEVDEFSGDNRGLILAEVELEREDQPVVLPEWAGREVTGDPRYFNAYLVEKPFTTW